MSHMNCYGIKYRTIVKYITDDNNPNPKAIIPCLKFKWKKANIAELIITDIIKLFVFNKLRKIRPLNNISSIMGAIMQIDKNPINLLL